MLFVILSARRATVAQLTDAGWSALQTGATMELTARSLRVSTTAQQDSMTSASLATKVGTIVHLASTRLA